MIEQKLHNLEELEHEVELLSQLLESTKKPYQLAQDILFRGQGNSIWPLKTTLERFTDKQYSIKSYNNVLYALSCSVNSLTNEKWEVESALNNKPEFFTTPPNYEFLIYARHHGFPSPLLDWSKSLYVALYFSYINANPEISEDVALFCFIDSLKGGAKTSWGGEPRIRTQPPYVTTHKRHYMQQAQYTCATYCKEKNWYYCEHSGPLKASVGNAQDVLYKFTLPASIRTEILKKLNEMNINGFTLFGNEEGLMQSVAFQEITIKD